MLSFTMQAARLTAATPDVLSENKKCKGECKQKRKEDKRNLQAAALFRKLTEIPLKSHVFQLSTENATRVWPTDMKSLIK